MASTSPIGPVDRAGAARVAGKSLPTIDKWYANRATTGFPERIPGTGTWDGDEVDAWVKDYEAQRATQLTAVDATGDPDELLTTTGVAKVFGYKTGNSLRQSTDRGVWADLLANVDEVTELAGGKVRRKWKRSTALRIAGARQLIAAGGGRPVGTPESGPVLYDGAPEDLLSGAKAAAVLGYSAARYLPDAVRALARSVDGQMLYRRGDLLDFAADMGPRD
ncbi:hypothetical protein AB0M43_36230 [Longispora sp. NPDC051575]|uniref:hypothetical protein n=1 Tax=Longispora sp. NPDC051575 TaxID=3154943 RepID=UPI00342BFBD3